MERKYSKIISPQILIDAYVNGCFPMADPETGEIEWFSPLRRAIFPIYSIKPSHSMKQILKKKNLRSADRYLLRKRYYGLCKPTRYLD